MRISAPPPAIEPDEGFAPGKDLFKRLSLGNGLTNIVTSVEEPLTIAVDAQWGTGKTTFLKMWAGSLRKAKIPVVYFDAFENDYLEDGFTALAREIVELTKQHTSVSSKKATAFKEQSIKVGGILLRGGLKLGATAAVRLATAGTISDTDLREAVRDAAADLAGRAEAYATDLIDGAKKQKDLILDFKAQLSALPALMQPGANVPLVYIIDELDRCRPTFALELLERIKHFFSVPNVHFVFGVHLGQLENSVRFAYGEGIDARTYLQKFLTLVVPLADTGEGRAERNMPRFMEHLKAQFHFKEEDTGALRATSDFILWVAENNQFSFRTVERIFTNAVLSLSFTDEKTLRVGPLIGGLCTMKIMYPELFQKALRKTLTYNDVERTFQLNESSRTSGVNVDWHRKWWRYCLLPELPDDLKDFGQSLGRYYVDDRLDIVSFTADAVVNRLSPRASA